MSLSARIEAKMVGTPAKPVTPHLLQALQGGEREREARLEDQRPAAVMSDEELEQPVGVKQRQHAQHDFVVTVLEIARDGSGAVAQVLVREHHALRFPGRSRRPADGGDIQLDRTARRRGYAGALVRQRVGQRRGAARRGVVHHHDATPARELRIHRLRHPRGRRRGAGLGESDDALQAFHPAPGANKGGNSVGAQASLEARHGLVTVVERQHDAVSARHAQAPAACGPTRQPPRGARRTSRDAGQRTRATWSAGSPRKARACGRSERIGPRVADHRYCKVSRWRAALLNEGDHLGHRRQVLRDRTSSRP